MPASRSVVLYNFYTQQVTLFESLSKISNYLNVPTSNVTIVAQGDTKYLVLREKYTVFYLDNFNYDNFKDRVERIQQGSRRRGFVAHDLLLNKDYTFNSTREAEQELDVNHTNISRALRGLLSQVKGYTFAYTNQINIPEKLPNLID